MKVIFDTNFWSYLADSDLEPELLRVERKFNLQIILPPSILLEAQKTRDRDKRIRIINAMSKKWRYKSRAEVDLESEEFSRELIRHYPCFRNHRSKNNKVSKLRKYWTKEVWNIAIDKCDSFHNFMIGTGSEKNELIARDQEENKKSYEKAGWYLEKVKPSARMVYVTPEDLGVYNYSDVGKKYEAWRVENFKYYKAQLKYHALPRGNDLRTVVDWCEQSIKIARFLESNTEQCDFWLEKAEVDFMPRNWLRSTVRALQPFRRISESNASDEQHTGHLVDADIFFTCDRRYHQILKAIHDDDTVRIAQPILLESNVEIALESIERILKEY